VVTAQFLLTRLLEADPSPAEGEALDAAAELGRYAVELTPDFDLYQKLLNFMQQYGLAVDGRVTRHSHHYVHERTTAFDLEVSGVPPEQEAEIGVLADQVEARIQAECVNINRKIYRALETAYYWENSDENVAENIHLNDYTFTESGQRGNTEQWRYADLDDRAKENARNWYRESAGDDQFWSEPLIDEWQLELEAMGFGDVDIVCGGFCSQGDGASFTAKRFDFRKWVAWWQSGTAMDKGHPYTDDLEEPR
jgi:hypothetical protein